MSKARAINVLALLLIAAAQTAVAQSSARAQRRLSLPHKDWALDITLPSAEAAPAAAAAPRSAAERDAPSVLGEPLEWLSDDWREYHLLVFFDLGKKGRHADARTVAVAMRPAEAAGGAEAYRNFALNDATKDRRLAAVKTSAYKQIPVARYRVELPQRLQLPPAPPVTITSGAFRYMQAFLVEDGVWVSVTLSGQELGEREERLFHSLLDSLKFTKTNAPSTSFDFYHKGRVLYMRRAYSGAAEALSAALEMERRERRLDRGSWRTLVINLVDSYAASRELARAKEVLDFGVAEDPTNPVFHMALARYHAMQGDVDNTIASLEKVFLNREKGRRAALLPDPARDPAFERFRNDERFRKAVKAMKK